VKVKFTVPATLAAGNYFVIGVVDTRQHFPDPDPANNTAVSAGTVTVV
jgi:hypothetical protein